MQASVCSVGFAARRKPPRSPLLRRVMSRDGISKTARRFGLRCGPAGDASEGRIKRRPRASFAYHRAATQEDAGRPGNHQKARVGSGRKRLLEVNADRAHGRASSGTRADAPDSIQSRSGDQEIGINPASYICTVCSVGGGFHRRPSRALDDCEPEEPAQLVRNWVRWGSDFLNRSNAYVENQIQTIPNLLSEARETETRLCSPALAMNVTAPPKPRESQGRAHAASLVALAPRVPAACVCSAVAPFPLIHIARMRLTCAIAAQRASSDRLRGPT